MLGNFRTIKQCISPSYRTEAMHTELLKLLCEPILKHRDASCEHLVPEILWYVCDFGVSCISLSLLPPA